MNKRLQIIPVLILLTTISMAQAVEKKKAGCGCSYRALYSLGDLEGEAGGKFQLQTVQGIRYGKWFTGVGAGLDYYHLRTIPLFLDIRREVTNLKNSPFVYADGGISFAWPEAQDKKNFGGTTTFSNGLYYDLGLGIRFALRKQSAILLSTGYSFKYLKEHRTTPVCINWNCMETTSELYKYKLNRLSLKVGVQL